MKGTAMPHEPEYVAVIAREYAEMLAIVEKALDDILPSISHKVAAAAVLARLSHAGYTWEKEAVR